MVQSVDRDERLNMMSLKKNEEKKIYPYSPNCIYYAAVNDFSICKSYLYFIIIKICVF